MKMDRKTLSKGCPQARGGSSSFSFRMPRICKISNKHGVLG
jgi:hypothetical protein